MFSLNIKHKQQYITSVRETENQLNKTLQYSQWEEGH